MMQFQHGPTFLVMLTSALAPLTLAQQLANREISPVGVWRRGLAIAVSEVAPEVDDDRRVDDGWDLVAVVDAGDELDGEARS